MLPRRCKRARRCKAELLLEEGNRQAVLAPGKKEEAGETTPTGRVL